MPTTPPQPENWYGPQGWPDPVTQAWFQAFMEGTLGQDPTPEPGYGPYHYHCAACDVTGHGEECWCCGTTDQLVAGQPARLTSAAQSPRYDEAAA